MDERPRILVVDADRETAGALERDPVRVTVVEDAESGLDALATDPFHCVVSEYALPGMDGVAFLRAVRDAFPALPFVLYTDGGSEAVASDAISVGVTEYMRKGVDDPRDLWLKVSGLASGTARRRRETGGEGRPPDESVAGGRASEDTDDDPVDPWGGVDPALRLHDITIKERAMDEAPIGITISDPYLDDNPMTYINDSFERLTGYGDEEALGVNCRFLQGEDTEEAKVDRMREAIAAEEPVSVELRNYTRDGELFWNRVDIAPIRDEDGEVTNFVGFQMDITDRVEAERAAERRAKEVAEERRTLERVLERIDGLIRRTSEVLVHATSRKEMEAAVCDVLAGVDPYVAAWVGNTDRTGETVEPGGVVGATLNESSYGLATDGESPGPTARAVETREVQVVTDPDAVAPTEAWHAEAVEGFAAMAAVPLVSRGTLYGVLHVYADDPAAFDEREVAVLASLGRMVATAMNASETRRVLTSDNLVELSFRIADPDLLWAMLSTAADCRMEYTGSVARTDGTLRTFFTVDGAPAAAVLDAAAAHPSVLETRVVADGEERSLCSITVDERTLVPMLAERGADTETLTAEDGVVDLTVTVPRGADPRTISDFLEAEFEDVTLSAYHERERPPSTRQEFIATLRDQLTERQLTALRTAYLSGFFEWPRPTSGDDLAESMGISRATFHQHLRAAERKLVAEFFED